MILRKVNFEDWKMLLDWRNDIGTRKNSHNIDMVQEEPHKQWLKAIIANEDRQLYIALENEAAVGTVRADFDASTDSFELSWTISPHFRGKGIGKRMVKALADQLGTRLRAEIKEGNIASEKIAEYAGLSFQKEQGGVLHYTNYA